VGAARLGAGCIFACDIEPEAAATARERFLRERIEVGLYTGSLRAMRSAAVDLLVANINAEALVYLWPEILRVLKADGTAILTGFPERHLARVEAVFTTVRQVMRKEEWAAVVGR
jgi:ribosomal protein L11 methylase PrmA